MKTTVPPGKQPQQPKGKGGGTCLGMGCATVAVLLAVLASSFIGGGLWALHHFKETYTSATPNQMPENYTSEEPSSVDSGGTSTSSTTSTTSTAINNNASASADAVPLAQVHEVEKQWKAFDKAADHNQKAHVEFSADEINALLQRNKNTRGKVFVSIDDNVAHVQFSIPLRNVPMVKGRYLNGEASVETSADGDPNKARITNIKLKNASVSDGIINQRFFGSASGRDSINSWLRKQNIETLKIENNRVIGETRGE